MSQVMNRKIKFSSCTEANCVKAASVKVFPAVVTCMYNTVVTHHEDVCVCARARARARVHTLVSVHVRLGT
jgi:hypothetical protein